MKNNKMKIMSRSDSKCESRMWLCADWRFWVTVCSFDFLVRKGRMHVGKPNLSGHLFTTSQVVVK